MAESRSGRIEALIDRYKDRQGPKRDFPYMTEYTMGMDQYGRPIHLNEDMSRSTERLIGFARDGREYLYPSIFGGKDIFEQYPNTKRGRKEARDEIISTFDKYKGYDPETAVFYGKGFRSPKEAEDFVKSKSKGHRGHKFSDLLDIMKRFHDLPLEYPR